MWITVMPSRKVEPHPAIPRPKNLKADFKTKFETLTKNLRKLFRELLKFQAALRLHQDSAQG
jgi:hypothetical protein